MWFVRFLWVILTDGIKGQKQVMKTESRYATLDSRLKNKPRQFPHSTTVMLEKILENKSSNLIFWFLPLNSLIL